MYYDDEYKKTNNTTINQKIRRRRGGEILYTLYETTAVGEGGGMTEQSAIHDFIISSSL